MNTTHFEDWQRISPILDAVLDLSGDERAAALDNLCAADQGLRSEVEACLEAESRQDDFLETPFREGSADLIAELAAGELHLDGDPAPGAEFGAYRLLTKIGEGGMGVVFEAEQKHPRRIVALKLLRSQFVTPAVQRRFVVEPETLARLHHPGIAQIFESGTADTAQGPRPFFAMEIVRGETLTAHATSRRLDLRQRLALVAQVCDAVDHAHRKGVIHRDLKPENILVDENGAPKILDFGIARVTDPEMRETFATTAGQIMGTIAYMSPEQIAGDADAVDARSDVYAIGMILYEMLAGRLPYEIRNRPLPEAARIVVEQEPKLLGSVDRAYRGDVETIVAKTLEKPKHLRYASASDLAIDIRRFLRNVSILARPPSTTSQLRKFALRHKGLVAGLSTAIVMLVAGLVASSWQAARATREAKKSETVLQFLQQMLTSADPASMKGRDVTVRQVLDEAAKKIDQGSLDGQPEIEGSVRRALGTTYLALGNLEPAEEQLRAAGERIRESFGPTNPSMGPILNEIASVAQSRGNYAEAESLFRESLALRRKRFGARHTDIADGLNNLGSLLRARGDRQGAESLFREALAMRRSLFGNEHKDVAQSLNNLAGLLLDQGKIDEAEPLYREALTVRRKLLGNEHPDVARSLSNLAGALQQRGNLDSAEVISREALAIRKQVLGPEHPDVAYTLVRLSEILDDKGDAVAAEPFAREAAAIRRKILGDDHPSLAGALLTLSRLMFEQRRAAESESLAREAVGIQARSLPPRHLDVAAGQAVLARSLIDQHEFEEAESLLLVCLSIREESLPPEHWLRFVTMSALGEALAGRKRFEDAESLLVRGYDGMMDNVQVPPQRKLEAFARVSTFYEAWAKPERLEAWRSTHRSPT